MGGVSETNDEFWKSDARAHDDHPGFIFIVKSTRKLLIENVPFIVYLEKAV